MISKTTVMKKLTSFALVLALAITTIFTFSAKDASAAVKAKSIKVTNASSFKTLKVGSSATIYTKVTPSKAKPKITFKSSKPSVVAVSKKGKVTAKGAGKAVITIKTNNGKKCSVTITVTTKEAVIYDMNKDKGDNGPKNNGAGFEKTIKCLYATYKYNWGAIWLCNAVFVWNSSIDGFKSGDKAVDYRGKAIHFTGEYMFTGKHTLTEVCAALNYTKPEAYPIINQQTNVEPNKWVKVDFTYTIPKDAENGDKNDETGKNYPIMFYYAWKTTNGNYQTGDDFYFRNFKITCLK